MISTFTTIDSDGACGRDIYEDRALSAGWQRGTDANNLAPKRCTNSTCFHENGAIVA